MTDPVIIVLSGVLIAFISGVIGKCIGSSKKISEDHCSEKRRSCQTLVIEKISNIDEKLDTLTTAVNNKLFGL